MCKDYVDILDMPIDDEKEDVTENISLDDILNEEIELGEDNDYHGEVESYYEMAQVKWGFMSIKLAVYGKEGKYPHFHFYKGCAPEKGIPDEKLNGGGCLCIESANYFIHGTHTEKMSPKEIDGLIEFLRKKNRTFTSITNWEYIVGQWNDNNPDQKQLPVNIDIPDYRSDMNTTQEDKRKNK